MQSTASTVAQYLDELPEERKAPMKKLYSLIRKNIPKGFKDTMQYGMISFVVPHSIYPDGYHCKPTDALPFMSIASQKNFIAIYHMGVYSDPVLYKWFTESYGKSGAGKLDMGKSCIRFKKMDTIPFSLIGELSSKITVDKWIATYENAYRKNK
jgi:hypothetical protein